MRLQTLAGLFLVVNLLTQSFSVLAFETDQYNLPTAPLADIGDEVSDYAEENVRKAVAKINAEIRAREACLEKNSQTLSCDSPEKERARLVYLRSEEAVAREVFKPLGGGIPPFTNSGTWMESHRFNAQPARFKTSFGKSIYRFAPLNYLTISETVRLYGVEFGTDKIAHIFQQGYTYYRIARRAREKNLSSAEAVRKAVRWGEMTEKTYYGYLVSGVYSNADLHANYVGMKFYEGLTRELEIGGKPRPAILNLKNGVWTFAENVSLRAQLLKPFISNHLNEAFNPSLFTSFFGLRATVRRVVKKQACERWRKLYPNHTQADFDKLTRSLTRWNGEDYGFKNSAHFITIANTCFDN